MIIDKAVAERILLEEAEKAATEESPKKWLRHVERLSEACESTSKTHIAMLGTALLAKATNIEADAFAVKAGASTPGAYSARSLGHGVLVPNAPRLGIGLGRTGREPLNNQPYFRIQRATPEEILPLVKDDVPVKILCEILGDLDKVNTKQEARAALRAFIKVRRDYQPKYKTESMTGDVELEQLISSVEEFVGQKSEGGRRAQAVAAGIMDMFAGRDRTEAGRVNDPDRHLPGDVGVRSLLEAKEWERVFEVRDKPVNEADLLLFAQKAAQEGITKAAVLAVAARQERFDATSATAWAAEKGVALLVFWGWRDFIQQAVFWSAHPGGEAATIACREIRNRLIEVEVAEEAIATWDTLLGGEE